VGKETNPEPQGMREKENWEVQAKHSSKSAAKKGKENNRRAGKGESTNSEGNGVHRGGGRKLRGLCGGKGGG